MAQYAYECRVCGDHHKTEDAAITCHDSKHPNEGYACVLCHRLLPNEAKANKCCLGARDRRLFLVWDKVKID